jgi:hypothetical protein
VHLLPRATRPRLLLGAAVALLAALALALTLVDVLPGGGAGASRTAATSDTVWPYYAETIAIRPPAYDSPLNVSIRETATESGSSCAHDAPGGSAMARFPVRSCSSAGHDHGAKVTLCEFPVSGTRIAGYVRGYRRPTRPGLARGYPLVKYEHSGVTRPCSYHPVELIAGQFVTFSG